MHIKQVSGIGETTIDEPHEVCNLKFLTRLDATKCLWTAGSVVGTLLVTALGWAMVTNRSITVLETKQQTTENTIIANQQIILSEIRALATKADNTRVGK
jgi:hypothetical protein